MSIPRLIHLSDLVLVPELSPRQGLNEDAVIRYMDSFPALPPIRVQRGTQVVIDGYHRAEAAVRLGLEQVAVLEEDVSDGDIRIVAALANSSHGEPLSRTERNRLAVLLVEQYGRMREEAAGMLGVSAAVVTMALREAQLNRDLAERLGTETQIINSSHVKALYRVGEEKRAELLDVIASKLDEQGNPRPLTGAELRVLVDRLLDPATPQAELKRLITDPHARPQVSSAEPQPRPSQNVDPAAGSSPWVEEEWQSPLRAGVEGEPAYRPLDDELRNRLEKAAGALAEQAGWSGSAFQDETGSYRFSEHQAPADGLDVPAAALHDVLQAVEAYNNGVAAAATALRAVLGRIDPPGVREQVGAVLVLLENLLPPRTGHEFS